MNDSGEAQIPVLNEVVMAGDADELPPGALGIDELARVVERIAGRIDRELEGTFETMVHEAVDEALRTSLAAYQARVRVLLLRELMDQLPKRNGPAESGK